MSWMLLSFKATELGSLFTNKTCHLYLPYINLTYLNPRPICRDIKFWVFIPCPCPDLQAHAGDLLFDEDICRRANLTIIGKYFKFGAILFPVLSPGAEEKV
jgi:hypothetical protein